MWDAGWESHTQMAPWPLPGSRSPSPSPASAPPTPTHVPGTQQVLRSAGPEVGTPESVLLELRGGQELSYSSWQL